MPDCRCLVGSYLELVPPATASRVCFARPHFQFIRAWASLRAILALAILLCLGALGARATTITVNVTTDANPSGGGNGSGATGDLRWAITQANSTPGSTIDFSVTGTITLTGALPAIGSDMTISGPGADQLTVSGSNSSSVGSIFSISSGTVIISGLTIANGVANAGVPGGGAIAISTGTVKLTDCTFSGNSAGTGNAGGAIYQNSGTLTVTNSTFYGNFTGSSGAGGAIFAKSGTLTVAGSTFYNNTTGSNGAGGAILISSDTATVTGSTFYGNSVGSSGGGGAIGVSGTATLTNNIFDGNKAGYIGPGVFNDGGTVTAGYNVFYNNVEEGFEDDCQGCNSNTNSVSATSDPLTLPLGNYGGTTETFLPQPGSAAICAGSSSDVPSGVTTDQRGWVLNSINCSNGGVDAGSVQTNYVVVNTLNDTSDIDCFTTCSLRDVIALTGTENADVEFESSLTSTSSPGTINLGTGSAGDVGLPAIVGQMNIIGPGANQLTISGNNDTNVGSVFTVGSNTAAGQATFYGLTITEGAGYPSWGGGGIMNFAGPVTVLDSAITNCSAGSGNDGGAIYNWGVGGMTLIDSTISDNTAPLSSSSSPGDGGGIFNQSTMAIMGSTIEDNSADVSGGGIYNDTGHLTMTDSTVAGNTSPAGGGVYNDGGATMAIGNSIVAGNLTSGSSASYADIDNEGTYNNDGGNVAGTSSSATSSINPSLSGLQYNGIGAKLQTVIPLPGSPAICAGETSLVPSGTTTDERGYPLQPSGGYCTSTQVDAGAVETNYTGVEWVQQPTTGYALSDISPAPTVEVLETDTLLSSNNTDGVNGIPVTLTFSGPGALTGTLTETTSGGVATYADLAATDAAMNDTLETSAITVTTGVTLPAVTSNSFDEIGVVSQFVVNAPANAVAGTPFTVTVTAEDAAGNTVPDFSGTVSISSTDGTVADPGFVSLSSGVATFSATLHLAGSQTISVESFPPVPPNVFTGTSGAIAVSAATAMNLAATAGTPQSAYVNVAFATALTTTVTDQYGNGVSGATVNFTAPSSGASAALSSSGSCTTGSNGSCSVTATANGTTGSYNVTAAVSGLTSVNFALTNNPPPSYVVTTLTDQTDSPADCTSGTGNTCSLRDAIGLANTAGAGNITFASGLVSAASPGTIKLGTGSAGDIGLPAITGYVNITGPGANQLTVSGNNDTNVGSVFTVNSGATLMLYGLTVTKGYAEIGGGINSSGTLTILDSAIVGNFGGNGGGIGSTGTVSIANSTISGNTANANGGAISASAPLTLVWSTVYGNSASCNSTDCEANGGGIVSDVALTIVDSTIAGNSATCSGPCEADGGGIHSFGGTVALANTIVAGNTSSGTANIGGSYTDNGGNTIGGSSNSDTSMLNGSGVIITLSGLQYNGVNATLQTAIPLPGSPAICAGLAANIVGATDERGYPNTNTSYAGYTPPNPACVDSGAVQTNYSLSFTTEPAPISPATTIYENGNFAAAVTLNESGSPFTASAVSIPLSLSGTGSLTGNTAVTSSGVATYSTLQVSAVGMNDRLTATLALNPLISSTSPAVSMASSEFNVDAPASTTTTSSNVTAPFDGSAQNVTLTATVTSPAGTVNEGSVQFAVLEGAAVIGTATLGNVSGGSASVSYTLPGGTDGGTYTIQAAYIDTNGSYSTSSDSSHTLTVTSAVAVSTTTSAASASAAYNVASQQVELEATVTSPAGTVNEGSVQFSVVQGTTAVGTTTAGSVSNGSASASYTLPGATAAGAYTIQAFYTDPTGNFLISAGVATLTVNAPTFVVTTAQDDSSGAAANCLSASSDCSLRDALAAAAASGGANVTFSPSVFAASNTAAQNTITLGSGGTLNIPANTSITGPTTGSGATLANLVTVAGGGSSSNFAIFTTSSDAINSVIQNLIITNANDNGSNGGAIDNGYQAALTIQNSTISGSNSTTGAGGIFNDYNASLTITGSTISGNSGVYGAIVNEAGGTVTITDSTIANNSASSNGGAILSGGVSVTVTNSTITGNSAYSGGGIFVSGGTLTLTGSIVAGNSASTSYADIDGKFIDNGSNQASNNAGTASQIAAGLAALGNYGGPTQTMIPLPGSAAICDISPSSTTGTDQRGLPRTTNYGNTTCQDAGAVQTNYGLNFTTNPAAAENSGVAFPAAVTLTESGSAFTADSESIPVTLSSGATLAGSPVSASTSAGVANYSLTVTNPAAATGLQLFASLTLNGTTAATATSSAFNLNPPITTTTAVTSNLMVPWSASSQTVTMVVDVTAPGTTVSGGTLTIPEFVAQTTITGTTYKIVPETVIFSGSPATFTLNLPGGLTIGTYTLQVSYADSSDVFAPSSDNSHTLTVGSAPTTTTSSNAATTYSATPQNVTLSATVTSSAGTVNAGTVTFTVLNGGTPLGSATTSGTVTNGQATASYSLPAGANSNTYTIQAAYSGSTQFAASSDSTHTLTISAAATTTSAANLSIAFSNSTQSIGLTAAVTSSAGTVNAGTVTFTVMQGGTPIGTAATSGALTNGNAIVNFTVPAGQAAGTYTIQAVYSGSTDFTGSSDNTHTLTIVQTATTTVASSSSATFSVSAQPITLAATVTSNAGTVNTGTVTFTVLQGSTPIGTAVTSATVTDGSASATYTLPAGTPAGVYTIQSVYSGSASLLSSSDNTHMLTVGQATATVQLSNLTQTYTGSPLAVTATTTPLGLTVNITYNGSTTPPTKAGSYTVVATVQSANYTGSATGTLKITQAAPSITWNAPAAITYGTALSTTQLDATASVAGTFVYTPVAGTVLSAGPHTLSASFTPANTVDYSTPGPVTTTIVVNAIALDVTANNATKVYGTANPVFSGTVTGAKNGDTFTESFVTAATTSSNVGNYSITPSVTGADLSDYTQVVTDGTLTITQAASSISLNASAVSITPGQPLTLTAAVASSTTGTPTGTVTFYDDTIPLGTVQLTNGGASFMTSALAPGITHRISASYSGDKNFTTSSTTASVSVTVAPLEFTITVNGATLQSVYPGGTATYTFNVAPLYGSYAGTMNFSISGLPSGITATFSPNSIPANGGPQTVTLTISEAALSSAASPPAGLPKPIVPIALGLLLLPLAGAGAMRRHGRKMRQMFYVLLLACGALSATVLSGCGSGNGFFAQAPKDYSLTITATAGSIQKSATVTLDVQ